MSDESLWIFGYGSLVWRPAFHHRRREPATIEGWSRRFWQGSTDHRGVPTLPGRVVTLLSTEHPDIRAESATAAACWGCAYEISTADQEGILAQLDHRESGGYDRIEVQMTLQPHAPSPQPVRGLMYVAHSHNQNYLGPAPVETIAAQILSAAGPSGTNPEYVFELAESLRGMGAVDRHVFDVESSLARLLRERAS